MLCLLCSPVPKLVARSSVSAINYRKMSCVLYIKYSTVVSVYGTVMLISLKTCSKQPPLIILAQIIIRGVPIYKFWPLTDINVKVCRYPIANPIYNMC